MTPVAAFFLYLFVYLVFVFIFFWIVQYSWNYGIRVISNNRVPIISYSSAAYVCLFFMAFFILMRLAVAPLPWTWST